jgi:hypothetical protein
MTTRTSNTLLGLLIIQNTVAALIARHVSADYNYDVVRLLFIAENLKLVLSMLLESFTLHKNSLSSPSISPSPSSPYNLLCQSVYKHIWLKPLDALKLSIPALLYLLQSIFSFAAIKMIPVPLFLIIQQTKLVKTTLLSIFMLKRSYSLIQWLSIASLCIGSSLSFLSVSNQQKTNHHYLEIEMNQEIEEHDGMARRLIMSVVESSSALNTNLMGIFLILASNFCSSLAGVYFELVVKGVDKNNDKNGDEDLDTVDNHSDDEECNIQMKSLLDGVDHDDKENLVNGTNVNVKQNNNDGKLQKSQNHHLRKSSRMINEQQLDINSNKAKESKVDEIVETCSMKQQTSDIISDQASIWMRNIQLSFFQICILAADILTNSVDESERTPIFGEFNLAMWIQIILFAFGGILVAAVIQKADNVQKGICMGLSVILTSALSILMDSSKSLSITFQFVMGSFLAIGGCFFFANPTLIDIMTKKQLLLDKVTK